MTSSNGNIFHVTGPLCGEFTGPGEFPAQRPVTQSFDVFFHLRLNKRLSKQPWGWWFETPAWSLWRHRNAISPLLSPKTTQLYPYLTNAAMHCISVLHQFHSLFYGQNFFELHYSLWRWFGFVMWNFFNKIIMITTGITSTCVLWTDIILGIFLEITSRHLSTLNRRRIQSIKISFKWWSPIQISWWLMCWGLLFVNFIKGNDSGSWSSVINKINHQRSFIVIIFLSLP